MRYLIFLLLITITIPKLSSAQKAGLINSGELIKKATTLYDSGKYKDALVNLEMISRSDTNYVLCLYRKALSCEADSQYTRAIKYCQEGLALKEQREIEPDLYNTYGNSLDEFGQPENAIKVFDLAITKYPSSSLFYFNKGIALMTLKRFKDAELLFQKSLLINPYMYSAHYQLGLAALQQGKIIPAYMSMIAYLLVNPEGRYWSKSINALDRISKSADDIVQIKNTRTIMPDANYQEVEDIVLSKIALDPSYKLNTSLNDPISRQIQAVFEKLQYTDSNNDFWIQYYLPYFKQVFNNNKFDVFIHHSFSNVKIPAIQDYTKKNKKELDAFVTEAAAYFNTLRATRELQFNKRESITERYLYENGDLIGKGTLANNGKILTGNWEGYYPAGNRKNAGHYNLAGEREGDWTFYFNTGILKANEHYDAGKLDGEQEYYFENGNMSSREKHMSDKLDGPYTTYYYGGSIKSTGSYKMGKKDGEEREYFSNGNLQFINSYTAGVLNGPVKEYFKSGKIKTVSQNLNGKTEGPYKTYYENGVLATDAQFSKDNAEGEFKFYYESGKIKEKRNYVNNNEEGLHQEFFENGQLSETYPIKKGKIVGEATWFYKDGKPFSKFNYDNGIIKSSKFIDPTGKEHITSGMKDNLVNVNHYTIEGYRTSHSNYNQKGELDGADTIFYPTGKINEINGYKNGEFDGPAFTFYLNGKKKSETNMAAGKENGYSTGFYVNGQLESEGWVQDGQNQGEWRFYNELGKLSTISNYLNGDLHGYKEDFDPSGKKSVEEKYYRGWLEKVTQLDTAGNIIAVDTFPKASGKYKLVYPNGKVMLEVAYENGDFNGPHTTWYFDGSLESRFFYKKGVLDSTYTSFYYGGAKNTEGIYLNGNKNGVWKMYDEDGKLNSISTYADNRLNGEHVYYFENGAKDYAGTYKDGELDGASQKYDPDGTLAYQVNFEEGKAKSYSYLGKDGKPVPAIPITYTNGTLNAFFPNGKPSRLCYYSDGEKNGQDIIYHNNGQLRSVDTVAFGVTNGLSKEYYPNGKLKSEYRYLNDNSHGICREFNENGTLKKEMAFDNGENHGPTKYYDKNGKRVKTMLYYYGKLLSVKNE